MRYELSFEESKNLCVAIQGFRLLKEMMLLALLAPVPIIAYYRSLSSGHSGSPALGSATVFP